MKSILVIPTYNEVNSLPVLLDELVKKIPELSVLVVDDNSPDGTAKIAQEFPNVVKCIIRAKKDGLASAYIEGFTWALQNDYALICQMDADGSHRVDDLAKMLLKAKELSGTPSPKFVVLGSRYVKSGLLKSTNWQKVRQLMSKTANYYTRKMLKIIEVKDITSGFRVYSAKALQAIFDNYVFTSKGYSFQVEMTLRAKNCHAEIHELPITFMKRVNDKSKMSLAIMFEGLRNVLVWAKRFKNS